MQCRKDSRLVIIFGRVNDTIPHRVGQVVIVDRVIESRHLQTPLPVGFEELAFHDEVVDLFCPRNAQQFGIGLGDQWRQPQVLCVVGDNQEVQRPYQSRPGSGRSPYGLAARESKRLIGAEKIADQAGVI